MEGKQAHIQRRLCERFAAPVIDTLMCQDTNDRAHAADRKRRARSGEGKRVQGMISALVTAGITGGYLANPRLTKVHWQAADRPLAAPQVSVASIGAPRPTTMTD